MKPVKWVAFPPLTIKDGGLILSREFGDHLHDAVTAFFRMLFESQGWESFDN